VVNVLRRDLQSPASPAFVRGQLFGSQQLCSAIASVRGTHLLVQCHLAPDIPMFADLIRRLCSVLSVRLSFFSANYAAAIVQVFCADPAAPSGFCFCSGGRCGRMAVSL